MPRNPNSSRQSLRSSNNSKYNSYNNSSPSQSSYESNNQQTKQFSQEEEEETEQQLIKSATNTQLTNIYINIAPLPIFHGTSDECAMSHLSRFTKVCRANNASSPQMMVKIFPVTLEDEAALWYDLNIEPYPSLSWEEIKLPFLEAYHKVELVDQLRSDLMTLCQGHNESVKCYKEWIIPQKPSCLNEALRLAFSFEQVQAIRGVGKMNVKCGFCEGPREENSCVVREKMRDLYVKCKEKKVMGSFKLGNQSDEIVKEESKNGDEFDEKKRMSSWRKMTRSPSQCRCSKHQCGMKNLERNNSIFSTTNSTAE